MVTCISSVDVDLQRRLLDSSLASCELVYYTLQQLGDTIGDKWLHNRLKPAHNSSSMNHNAISVVTQVAVSFLSYLQSYSFFSLLSDWLLIHHLCSEDLLVWPCLKLVPIKAALHALTCIALVCQQLQLILQALSININKLHLLAT